MTNSELLAAISEMFDAKLAEKLDTRLASIENRLESLENRVESVENRLEALENRFESLENRFESLENRVVSLEIKSDSTEHSIASIINVIINIQLLLENQILPRLQTIESCYLDTYERYSAGADKIQATIDDVDILKKVVRRHSELLQMTS